MPRPGWRAPPDARYKQAMPDASAALALSHDRTQRTALIALFAGALAIAFAPIFVRLSEVGPTATAFWRVALATPVLAAWMVAERPGFSRRSPTGFRDFAGLARLAKSYPLW